MLKYRKSGYRQHWFFIGCVTGIFLFTIKSSFLLANDGHFVYDSKNKRDPFIPLIGKNVKLTDVELLESITEVKVEGVVIDPQEGSAAIVNGQLLRVGDFMGGFRLVRVTPYSIYMERDGKEYALTFRNKSDDEI